MYKRPKEDETDAELDFISTNQTSKKSKKKSKKSKQNKLSDLSSIDQSINYDEGDEEESEDIQTQSNSNAKSSSKKSKTVLSELTDGTVESEVSLSEVEDEEEIDLHEEPEESKPQDYKTMSKKQLHQMLTALKESLPEKLNHRYTTSMNNFNWNSIAFDGFNGQDCKYNFKRMLRTVRKHRTLLEIAEDMIGSVNRLTSRHRTFAELLPDRPKPQPTVYLLFSSDYRKKLREKNPELDIIEIAKRTGEKWRSLSDKKKQKYIEKYGELKAKFDEEMEQFKFNNPDYFSKEVKLKPKKKEKPKPKPKPKAPNQSPFQLYLNSKLEKYENVTDVQRKELETEYRTKWDSLSNKRKYKFIELAIKSENTVKQSLIDQFGEDSDKVKKFRSSIRNSERDIYDKVNGKPEKPPASGFYLFVYEYDGPEVKDKTNHKDRVQACRDPYRSLPEETKQQLTIRAKELNDQYMVDVQEYCKKLNDRDMMSFLMKNTNSVNKKFLLSKLLTKDSGEDKITAFDAIQDDDEDEIGNESN